MPTLDGKVALVTGGASGIGLASAELFAAEGAHVVVVDMNADAGQAAAASTGGMFIEADVGSSSDWKEIVAELEAEHAGVDVAFLNAGVPTAELDVTQLTDEQYHRVMRTNIDGILFGIRALVPVIERGRGGAVIATSSLAGLLPFIDPIYTLTKHAIVGLVRALADPLAAKSITINAICPSVVDTPALGDTNFWREAGFTLMPPRQIAEAVLQCALGSESGQAYVCQPGREPVPYRFARVPGPRL